MTKFNFLLDQIKGPDVKAVLTILQTAKSKLIQVNDRPKEPILSIIPVSVCLAMENSRWENHRCGQRSQGQCPISVHLGEILRAAVQFRSCWHVGMHSGSDQCCTNDSLDFPLLQYLRAHDILVCQGKWNER